MWSLDLAPQWSEGVVLARRRVLLYELNEVPWSVVDHYVSLRPASTLASLLQNGRCLTSRDDDPAELSPWRTWPTFHKSLYTADHNSYELGQDPSSFRGTNVWDVVAEAGLSVGLFGALQSWPARHLNENSFYVPDTFARDAKTEPAALRNFQRFNLKMTAENSFSSDSPLNAREAIVAGLSLMRLGLSQRSAATIAAHLLREQVDGRHKGARSMMQALPSFDLFWRLFKQYQPSLSVFFTNHVAAMMHRFWGDAMPSYAQTFEYQPDPVFATFLTRALDIADAQLARLVAQTRRDPSLVLLVAASMGQDAIPAESLEGALLYLEDGARLLAGLGLSSLGGRPRLAMHPMCGIDFDDTAAASKAAAALRCVLFVDGGGPVFEDVELHGRAVTFRTSYRSLGSAHPSVVVEGQVRPVPCTFLGLSARPRLGGSNTAYHVPEGILIAAGSAVTPSPARAVVNILDIAPTILHEILHLAVPNDMVGKPDPAIFELRGAS